MKGKQSYNEFCPICKKNSYSTNTSLISVIRDLMTVLESQSAVVRFFIGKII